MGKNELQLFRQKATELARTELEIWFMMQQAGQHVDVALSSGDMPEMTPVILPAALAVLSGVGALLTWSQGMVAIGLAVVCLFLLGKTYSNWKSYQMRKNALDATSAFAGQAKELEGKQKKLISELNSLRGAQSSRYWWDAELPASLTPKMPGSGLSAEEDWKLGIFHEIQLETRSNGVYLHDMHETPVFCTAERVEALRTGQTGELYRDDYVYQSGATAYACLHLYAYNLMPIEEIHEHSMVERVNRQEVLKEYRNRIDEYERNSNLLLNGSYLTHEGMYMAGKVSANSYMEADIYRSLAEHEFKNQIPDEIRHVHYSQSFDNLWYMEFLTCALIFVAADGPRAGQTALILIPQREQESLEFTVRLDAADKLSGYLESFAGIEPLSVGGEVLRPSLKIFADALFRGPLRDQLQLRKRDPLQERPRGLTDGEWVWLMRQDLGGSFVS